jgi:hypothetical protein
MGTVTDASKEVGLEISAEETKYMLLSNYHSSNKSKRDSGEN